MGGASDVEQPRGLGATKSSGAILGVSSGCPWPGTILPSLCLGQPGRGFDGTLGSYGAPEFRGGIFALHQVKRLPGVLSFSWSFPALSRNTREMVHGMFSTVKPNFGLSESPMLAGGHLPPPPPGLGRGSLESGHLGRRRGYSAHPLGSTDSQARFDKKPGCGWRRATLEKWPGCGRDLEIVSTRGVPAEAGRGSAQGTVGSLQPPGGEWVHSYALAWGSGQHQCPWDVPEGGFLGRLLLQTGPRG